MNFPRKRQIVPYILSAFLIVFALFPAHLAASALTLAWDPNREDDLAGYKVYYGTRSWDYDFVVDVGNVTQYTVTGLESDILYYFAATAYDTSGNESDFSDEVSGVPTDPTNAPPTADAGPDQVVSEGVTVILDASNSSDPDDGIASYLWEQTGGISVTLSDPTAVQPTFTAPNVGPGGASLTFRLTVTDNGGLQSTDTCIVNVTWENTPPTANAGPDQVVLDSDEVTLDGSQSYGTIVFYEWILHHRETSTDRFADGVKPVVSDLEPGFYEVKLTVTDGELTDTDTMLLAVGPCAY